MSIQPDSILVSESSIQPGKFSQLHATQIILPFRRFYSLFDNFTNLAVHEVTNSTNIK